MTGFSPRLRTIVICCILGITAICVFLFRSKLMPANAATPLPVTSKHTDQEYRKNLLALNRRTIIDAYQEFGHRSPAWDEQVSELLDEFLITTTDPPEKPDWRHMAVAAKAILDKGCRDPLILYICGKGISDTDELAAIPYLQKSTEMFAASKYPKFRSRFAPYRLSQCLADTRQNVNIAAVRTLALQWTADALNDGSLEANEEPLYLESLFKQNNFYESLTPELLGLMKAGKCEDHYAYQVLLGIHEINLAWQARGNGYANTVTQQGWKDFSAHMKNAETILTAAWKAHPDYPQAPSRMINVAMGSQNGDVRLWFDRTVAAQFDFIFAYDNYEFTLTPRWGGSHEAMYQFAEQCLQTKRYDTMVPAFYLSTLWNIERDGDTKTQAYWSKPGVYENLKMMFAGYEQENNPYNINWFRSVHAATAWRYKDYRAAKAQLDILGDKVVTSVFTDYERARQEIEANAR